MLSLYFPLVKLSMFMFPFNNDQNDIQALKLSKNDLLTLNIDGNQIKAEVINNIYRQCGSVTRKR